ncbi:MAG: dihydrodipicolinate synthase family protein [Chthonomonadales bacterium]
MENSNSVSGQRLDVYNRLQIGLAIPAHPLALMDNGRLDEKHQRALTRYYLAAGAGGLAVGVHTTQFAIREHGLFKPVLELAMETARGTSLGPVMIAGACGDVRQAVAEAELAASLGYDAVLLSPGGLSILSETDMTRRTIAVGEVLPVIGFYLQPDVGGRRFSLNYWRSIFELECIVGVKVAPFDRYLSQEVERALAESGNNGRIALYTGNDDNIVNDLIGPYVGGLLGQWAVGTRFAVELIGKIKRCKQLGSVPFDILKLSHAYTDINLALFDVNNGFAGCIAGIHEILFSQGLLGGVRCLDENEILSPGQREEIDRVLKVYGPLFDNEFIEQNLDNWLR